MNNFGKILVIVPHRDDEALGLGGLLTQYDPDLIHLRYYNSVHPNVDPQRYDQEALAVSSYLGCETSYCLLQDTNHLDHFPIAEFVSDIEETLNYIIPQTVFVPFPSYNQDHRVLFEAAITATRIHDVNCFPKNVLVYEQPETQQTNRLEPQFRPEVFVEIDIDEKLKLYEFYQSQQRAHRDLGHIKALARVRGMQCGSRYAEAFHVVRMSYYKGFK